MAMESVKVIRGLVLALAISLLCFSVSTTATVSVCCGNQETTIPPYGVGNQGNTPYNVRNIQSIVVEYSTKSLESLEFRDIYGNNQKVGGVAPIEKKSYTINLEDGEYLTGVSFGVGKVDNIDVVKSITFFTNRKQAGPFGPGEGTKDYSIQPRCAKITGFHGGYGWRIDTVGVYFVYVDTNNLTVPKVESI